MNAQWNKTATYLLNDIVVYSGIAYKAISTNTNSPPPSLDWVKVEEAEAKEVVLALRALETIVKSYG